MRRERDVTIDGWLVYWGVEVGDDRRMLALKDEELAVFLAGYADMMHMKPCPMPDCDGCGEAQRFWWDWCNSLRGDVRVALQNHLKQSGIPLPSHPGDDVDAVPAPLD